jgi:dTMP kinase
MDKGIFISFEGIDGCGKSTHMGVVEKFLREKGFNVKATREPGGTELAELIRSILLDAKLVGKITPTAELLLYLASRHQHGEEVIRPFLEGGGVVLSDRYADSSTAYQGVGRGLGIELVEKLNELVIPRWPDLTIIFDISAEVAVKRTRHRALDRLEREGIDFLEMVRGGYLELAQRYPERIIVIDSSGEIEETESKVVGTVEKFIEHFQKREIRRKR